MATRPLQARAQLLCRPCLRIAGARRLYSRKLVQENDVVLLSRKGVSKGDARSQPMLSKPLVHDKRVLVNSKRDHISTNDIIGKHIRDVVTSRERREYRITEPSLGAYSDLSSRLVTPIYSQDASLIVSLLDLHPTTPPTWISGPANDERVEVFEAGTGHGALTLHLARAVHGANIRPPTPYAPIRVPAEGEDPIDTVAMALDLAKQYAVGRSRYPESCTEITDQIYEQQLANYIAVAGELGARVEFSILAKKEEYSSAVRDHFNKLAEGELPMPQQSSEIFDKLYQEDLDGWRAHRRAVVHTLDIDAEFSKHAQGVVKNFRQGMYFHNVDFHVSTIQDYLLPRLDESGEEPFFDHAILDLPDTHDYLEILGRSLKPNGSLVTWNPSITQVLKCINLVREKKLPFLLEKVLEMGVGGGSGGRLWDVRRVRVGKRSALSSSPEVSDPESDGEEVVAEVPTEDDARYEMICRPKVGNRTEGGGFIGLWRRMEQKVDT